MPPGRKLPAGDVEALSRWVEMGAPWPGEQAALAAEKVKAWDWPVLRRGHWAWQPVRPQQPPTIKDAGGARNPLDLFVRGRLEAAGLVPTPEADRRTLIRRASLDLIGLPPTPAEVDAFLKDQSPQAYEQVVDRLLASPRYGERWARYWLDVARYNDGYGNGFDGTDKPQAYRYRDWVVGALNRDLPYDQFIKQQIAGNLLDDANAAVATGFLALGPVYSSDGGDPDSIAKAKGETLDDRLDTLSRGLQAITVACTAVTITSSTPFPRAIITRWQAFSTAPRGGAAARHRRGRTALPASPASAERPGRTHQAVDHQATQRARGVVGRRAPVAARAAQGSGESQEGPSANATSRARAGRRQKRGHARGPAGRPAKTRRACPPAVPAPPGRREAGAVHPRQRPAGTGRRADRPQQPVDRSRLRQPRLDGTLRPGPGANARQLRRPGRKTDPPRAARLAGARVRAIRLVDQGAAPPDHAVGDVPDEQRSSTAAASTRTATIAYSGA